VASTKREGTNWCWIDDSSMELMMCGLWFQNLAGDRRPNIFKGGGGSASAGGIIPVPLRVEFFSTHGGKGGKWREN